MYYIAIIVECNTLFLLLKRFLNFTKCNWKIIMQNKELIIIIEKMVRVEEFGINIYSNLSRKFGKKEEIGIQAERIAKEKIETRQIAQTLLNQIRNNKIHFTISDNENLKKLTPDRIISKYESAEDDGKPYTSLVKLYNYQRELLKFYDDFIEISGNNKDIQLLILKSQSHFDIISNYVDVQYEKYQTISDFWD